ncbi:Aspartyl dipeptidase [Granulibacter bethesdensis]|nr:Aspartyl dipeptidase [Granulibacter bethesdensis]
MKKVNPVPVPLPDPLMSDPLALAQALMRCPSVTPLDAGAQSVLAEALTAQGFTVTPLPFGDIANFYAKRVGTGSGPHLCFAGHTDVVPLGDAPWSVDAFAGEVHDGVLIGRGACDMKGAIASFVAACAACPDHPGTISLLITGDEEGVATDGTVRVLDWMRQAGEIPDFCVVGEPTNPGRLGEVIKIGRRGSLNATLTVRGRQGHVAYPHRADNPLPRLVAALHALTTTRLDDGMEGFEPSSLQLTTVDVGNPATNVIPEQAQARLNIRFNPLHRGDDLARWLRGIAQDHAPDAVIDIAISGEAFVTDPDRDPRPGASHGIAALRMAIQRITGLSPRLDTGGGTSDARFITHLCPVVEFGLVGATMHQRDEAVAVQDLRDLTRIYEALLDFYLGKDGA